MAKVKIVETKRIVTEADIDYPVYFHFQDELCNNTLVKVDESYYIEVKYDMGYIITTGKKYIIKEQYLNDATSEEHFKDFLKEALDFMFGKVWNNRVIVVPKKKKL